jgi:uncharacterized Zn finger protein
MSNESASYCLGCGCSVVFHDAVNRIGDETIAHCENCGLCWKTANTPYVQLVKQRLRLT